jgi:hypothetical protein
VHVVEVFLSIECEIPLTRLFVKIFTNYSTEEEWLVYLDHLDEHHQDTTTIKEAHKNLIKDQYDKNDHP